MAFKMKGSPFLQTQGTATETPQTREVDFTSGRASNKSIRQFVRKVKRLGTGISADITSTNEGKTKEGSYIGSVLGLGDYYKKKDYGTVQTEPGAKPTEKISRKESRVLKRELKAALKKGGNVHVEGTKVTSGNVIKRTQKVNAEKEAAVATREADLTARRTANEAKKQERIDARNKAIADRKAELEKRKAANEAKRQKPEGAPQRKSVLKKNKPNYKTPPLKQTNPLSGEKLISESSESYEGEQGGRKGKFFKRKRTYSSDGTSGPKKPSNPSATNTVKGRKGGKGGKVSTPGKTRNEEDLQFRPYEEAIKIIPADIKPSTTKITATPMPRPNIVTSLPETLSISAGGSKVNSRESTKLFPGTFAKKKTRKCTTCN